MIDILTLGAAIELSKSAVTAKIQDALEDFDNGITMKGSVEYFSSLPDDAEVGDEYLVLYSGDSGTNYLGMKYVWDGEDWRSLGTMLNLYRDTNNDLCEGE